MEIAVCLVITMILIGMKKLEARIQKKEELEDLKLAQWRRQEAKEQSKGRFNHRDCMSLNKI